MDFGAGSDKMRGSDMVEPAVKCAFDEMSSSAELLPHPKNYRVHPDEQVRLLGEIIAKTGWRRPITVSARSGYITKGHGAHQAALARGWQWVPVDLQDYASEAEELADLAADNRLSELAASDDQLLAGLLQEILDGAEIEIEQTGYGLDEVNRSRQLGVMMAICWRINGTKQEATA